MPEGLRYTHRHLVEVERTKVAVVPPTCAADGELQVVPPIIVPEQREEQLGAHDDYNFYTMMKMTHSCAGAFAR